MPARTCFVISPIGDHGSEVREHADDVFDYIIKPAMSEVGMSVTRADQDLRVGRISEQMFESILSADLCIAVLNGQNPNVFYELAIAQSAARPVIILNPRGHTLPFDVKDLRVIEYSLRPRMIQERVYAKQITDMVRDLEQKEWAVPIPFGPDLTPLRRKHGVGSTVYRERQEEFAFSQDWLRLIDRGEKELDFCGINLRYWTGMNDFLSLIEKKASAGCQVRFLLMDEQHPALPSFVNSGVSVGFDQLVEAIRFSRGVLTDLAQANPNQIELRLIRTGCPRQQIVRADNQLWLSLLLHSEPARRSPIFECSPPSSLGTIMYHEFGALWRANATAAGGTVDYVPPVIPTPRTVPATLAL